MFDFLDMVGNYEQRKVENTKVNGAIIDTAAVNDSSQPYETGIMHPSYNSNNWIIVELYPNKKKAQEGHQRWVKEFTSNSLPEELRDVNTCEIGGFVNAIGGQSNGIFKRKQCEDKN